MGDGEEGRAGGRGYLGYEGVQGGPGGSGDQDTHVRGGKGRREGGRKTRRMTSRAVYTFGNSVYM